jgi:hypothetical protein
MKMCGHFINLAGSVLGDMGSTATLMKDAGGTTSTLAAQRLQICLECKNTGHTLTADVP